MTYQLQLHPMAIHYMSLCHTYLGFFWVSKMTLHMNYEISMTSSDYLCDTLLLLLPTRQKTWSMSLL